MRSPLLKMALPAVVVVLVILPACTARPQRGAAACELPPGLPTAVYLPPSPTLAEGGALLGGCPNPAGLEDVDGIPDDGAVALVNDFRSGDCERARQAADPALWPILGQCQGRPEPVTASWLDGPAQPARESPYVTSLAHQCGEDLVEASWDLRVCPGPCSSNSSESLKEDYFLLSRAGRLLIWALWP